MCVLHLEEKNGFEFQYGQLFKGFGWSLTKNDLARVLGVGLTKIDYMVTKGECPKFKRLGKAKNSRVVFFTYDVAKWMCGESI